MTGQGDDEKRNSDPGGDLSHLRAMVEAEPVPERLRLLARRLAEALEAARNKH